MKNPTSLILILMSLICCSATVCGNSGHGSMAQKKSKDKMEGTKIKINVGPKTFKATLNQSKTAEAFRKLLPVTLTMVELNKNEKYYDLAQSLPIDPSNPESISSGDLMLFGQRTLVLFYKTVETSYSYTKLGKVDDPAALASTLGPGDVTVTFDIE